MDYDDWVLPQCTLGGNDGLGVANRWDKILIEGGYVGKWHGSAPYVAWGDAGKFKLFRCPSADKEVSTCFPTYTWSGMHYLTYMGWPGTEWGKRTSLKPNMMYFGEQRFGYDTDGGILDWNYPSGGGGPQNYAFISNIHNGGTCNVMFIDGHVEPVLRTDMCSSDWAGWNGE